MGSMEQEEADCADDEGWCWPYSSSYGSTTLLVLAISFLLRILLSFNSYSGEKTPPKYGDYEAQRHWMEITIHTPVSSWYQNTTDNDLEWWGLDYPPLTAYQSYVHGLMVYALDPETIALHSSRGFETPSSKILLRWTVLLSDLLVFFPAMVWFMNVFYSHFGAKQRIWALAMALLQPGLMLIDHGHFQYNCISLGLSVGAAAALVSRRELMACVLFSLSLNHKQMSMYYAPAFFAHLLGRSFQRRNWLLRVFCLGCTVILSFTLCWWPFLHSKEAAMEVLSRILPLHRGIYEDYVANFWCVTAILFKWKRIIDQPTLAKISLGATFSAFLPSVVQQIRAPSGKGFLYAMLNSSFAFYLFSYQVHEKSILLPLMPATLLALEEPQVLIWMVPFATFSMLPLLLRDGQIISYYSLLCLFFLVSRLRSQVGRLPTAASYLSLLSTVGGIVLHAMYCLLQPPKRYPFLFEALIMSYSFPHFVALALYSNWKQWSVPCEHLWKQKIS